MFRKKQETLKQETEKQEASNTKQNACCKHILQRAARCHAVVTTRWSPMQEELEPHTCVQKQNNKWQCRHHSGQVFIWFNMIELWSFWDLCPSRTTECVGRRCPDKFYRQFHGRTVSLKGASGIFACVRQGFPWPCKVAHQGGLQAERLQGKPCTLRWSLVQLPGKTTSSSSLSNQ